MNQYQAHVFGNGRIVLIPEKDYSIALDKQQEILVVCNSWCGTYVKAFGVKLEQYFYGEGDNAYYYNYYSYDIKNATFTPDEILRFYRVVVTNGIDIYMKTGKPATSFLGNAFSDWDTKYQDYLQNNCGTNENITEETFKILRHQIDVETTLRMVHAKTKEEKCEIQNAIKRYLQLKT